MKITHTTIEQPVSDITKMITAGDHTTISNITVYNPNDSNVDVEVWLGGSTPGGLLLRATLSSGLSVSLAAMLDNGAPLPKTWSVFIGPTTDRTVHVSVETKNIEEAT